MVVLVIWKILSWLKIYLPGLVTVGTVVLVLIAAICGYWLLIGDGDTEMGLLEAIKEFSLEDKKSHDLIWKFMCRGYDDLAKDFFRNDYKR